MDEKRSVTLMVTGVVIFVVALIVGAVTCTKLTSIPPGYVGVSVKKCGGGGVSQDPIPTGYYWRELFCEEIVKYPTSMQNLILTSSQHEGSKLDESITVTSSEGLNINLDVALNFTLDAKKVPSIYERWRAPIGDIAHKYVRQTIREMLQATFAKYTAEELYSTKKEIARIETEQLLIEKLEPIGLLISQFTINRVSPPKQVVDAINAKVAMIQDAQRSEQEVRKKQAEAAQKVAEAKGRADSMEAEAAGEAKAITLRAEAQAKANEILSRSITMTLIEYEKANKWDGKLPQVSGGGTTPMIQLK